MAVEKIINIKVQETGLDELNKELVSLDSNLNKVDSESKKASTGLKDVGENGGAIAILDSLTGGLATRVRDAYEATKLFNFSLKGTRKALIATGIGALVVALGVVVAYWDDIVEFIDGANKKLEEQKDLLQDNITAIDSQLSLLKKQIEFNKLRDKSNVDNLKNQKDLLLAKKKLVAENILLLETQLATAKSEATQLSFWQKFYGKTKAKGDIGIIDAEERENINNLTLELNKLKEAALDVDSLLNPAEDVVDPTINKREKETVQGALSAEQQQALLDKKSEQFEEIFGLEKMQQEMLDGLGVTALENFQNSEVTKTAIASEEQRKRNLEAEEGAETVKRILAEEAKFKEQEYRNNYNNLQNIISVGGKKMNKISKALAIADVTRTAFKSISETVSSTAAANAKAVASSPLTAGQPFVAINTIKAALSIGSTLASSAKSIQAIQGESKSVSGSANAAGGGGGGGGGVAAPSFNVVGTSGVNQLAESLQQDQQPVQAYVVGSNVTSQQELDRNIVDQVSLG